MKCIVLLSLSLCFVVNMRAQNFVLNGNISSTYDGLTIALVRYDDRDNIVSTDSTVIKNGAFKFKGNEYLSGLAKLMVRGDQQGGNLPEKIVFLEKGDINVNIDVNEPTLSAVSGTALNNLYQMYCDSCQYYWKDARDIQMKQDPAKGIMIEKGSPLHKAHMKLGEYMYSFKRDNFSNPVGRLIFIEQLGKIIPEDLFILWNDKDINELFGFIDERTMEIPKVHQYFIDYCKTKDSWGNINPLIGTRFLDMEMSVPNGELSKISDYIKDNKYVLIDFWASWCYPCLAMIPSLKNIYEKYNSHGFEIVGVSIDENISDWTAMLEKKSLPWPQLKVDNEDVKELFKAYNIKGVPYGVLVDQEGKIVLIMDFMMQLEEFLEENMSTK